jgi:hypothetical protein
MMLAKALASASASAAKVYVEDVFSTWLYTGNGSTQTITNGIDLSGKGGLVWVKARSSAEIHNLYDTARGANKLLYTNGTAAQVTRTDALTSFTSSGFTLGIDGNFEINTNNTTYASWTFRKAAKFFDVVTYTGDGSNRTISHNLGSVPGCIIVKRTDTTSDWAVYHRGVNAGSGPQNYIMLLNTTAAQTGRGSAWNDTAPTSTVFTLGTHVDVNANGGSYVAYLFAHDAGGFGDAGTDSVVKCGSYTGASGLSVNLGWEPQWLLVKNTSSAIDWVLLDNMRNFSETRQAFIYPNASSAETATANWVAPTATGFRFLSSGDYLNQTGDNYIYIAIRRGPMKTPTDATKVFDVAAVTQAYNTSTPATSSITTDLFITGVRNAIHDTSVADRLRGAPQLLTNATDAEAGTNYYSFARQTGVGFGVSLMNSNPVFQYFFRRAPGFFDVVAYTGNNASSQSVSHSLGAVPEMMIVKARNSTTADPNWGTYHQALGNTKAIRLNQNLSALTGSQYWNDTSPTSTVFTVGDANAFNKSGDTFIVYLFATCPGVSKVFTFTGNGTSQTINCGFTSGARFVLVKRTDSTGNWLVADTARGIVSGNDPLLYLNSTAAEITTLDWIDPDSSGFIVNQEATANANVNGATYIGLAIA